MIASTSSGTIIITKIFRSLARCVDIFVHRDLIVQWNHSDIPQPLLSSRGAYYVKHKITRAEGEEIFNTSSLPRRVIDSHNARICEHDECDRKIPVTFTIVKRHGYYAGLRTAVLPGKWLRWLWAYFRENISFEPPLLLPHNCAHTRYAQIDPGKSINVWTRIEIWTHTRIV